MVKSGKLGNKNGEGFLNKEKLEVSPIDRHGVSHSSDNLPKEKIDNSTELVIDLSTSSIEDKVNFYQSSKIKKSESNK